MYEDKNVREHMNQLKDGEDAIAFFAKYGNTTPIKFIHCIKNKDGVFNPYKLSIVHNANDLAKVDEYYTVSPSGIVLIYSSSQINKKEKFMNKTPTEFISLSDWMRESTLFNILSNIDFFKNYLTSKVLRSWRENVKKTLFKKTREKIRNNVFYCKPQFVNSVFEIKSCLTNVLNFELVNFSQYQQKKVDFEEFKSTQKDVRTKVSKEFEIIFEEILANINRLINSITNTKNENSNVEEDISTVAKHKPLNLIKKEKEERIHRKDLSETDFKMLSNFIRLINYMSIETLVEINKMTFLRVEEELYKERKNGLFTTSPTIEDNNITFLHREEDIVQALNWIFDENIRLVQDVPKILTNPLFEQFVRDLLPVNSTNFALISPNINTIISESSSYKKTKEKIEKKIKIDFLECRKKIDINFSQCKRIEQEKNRFNVDLWIASEPKLEEVKAKLIIMRDFKKESGDKIKDYFYGILHIDSKIMRNILTNFITDSLNKIKEYLYQLMMEKVAETNKSLDSLVGMLSQNFDSLQEYCDYIKAVREVRESVDKLDANKATIEQMFKLLRQVNLNFTIEDKSNIDQITKQRDRINDELPIADDLIKSKKEDYISKLVEQTDYVNDKSEELFILLQCEELRKSGTPSIEANKRISIAKERLEKLENRCKKVKEHMTLMETNVDDFRCDIALLTDIFDKKKEIWENYDMFFKKYEEWFEGNIKKINIENIEKEVKKFEIFCRDIKLKTNDQTARAMKTFPQLTLQGNKNDKQNNSGAVVIDDEENNEVLSIIAGKVENMKELMPILSALCNKNLKDKHWVQILEMIEGGTSLLGKQFINFQELIGLNVKTHFETIEDISARATGEFSIEQDLEKIKRDWLDTVLTIVPYRDLKEKYILSGVTDCFEKLDDHLLKIQSMLSSKFAFEIKDNLQNWERRLSLIHETLEEWVLFQQQWMYLENVFSADDIQKQLPSEYSKFYAMDKFWKETMLKVQKKSGILDNISGSELLNKFIDSNKQMELIQRMLEDYLELKRKAFPRFYFLSNDELLEIFSQTRNPEAIQPHLRKCFDNIKSIRFEDSEMEKEKIIAMISAEPESDKEIVEFNLPVIAKGPIEEWLRKIEETMQKTLYLKLSQLITHMSEKSELLDFDEIFKYPAQVVLVLNMIRWTFFAEHHINENTLDSFYKMIQAQIFKSVELIKSDLTVGQRELIKNMIINDVHNRDIVQFIIDTKSSVSDFNWNKQFKYYWMTPCIENDEGQSDVQPSNRSKSSIIDFQKIEKNQKNCFIGQTNSLIAYGYEYLGNSSRLVITPLTDKCYLTLTSALNLTYGGAPAGPAGTGKTETTKDLAKAVAIVCIVFNCSDSLEYKTMGRFFSGLAQCGAWACFDEFNRIDVEVLSVIAQQIMVIQNAMRERKKEFDFEGKIIPLSQKFGVFITMNPGYAGRSELPDNLKALFRPVAMMIPDYALIAEIMLFSEGFQNAKEFGKKLVLLFKLSSEQLSKQKHYDFGMRAVKAVLNMAGITRRNEPEADEDEILLKSMRDSNLPKFLSHDIGLFTGIIKDLFPKRTIESKMYPELTEHCTHYLNSFNYQVSDSLLTKIRQLYEVSNIRHGVMNVGNASSGKTTAMEALMNGLHKIGIKVDSHKLNPKAVTINELFGFNDIYTNTFTHGIVSKIVTQAMEDTTDSRKWIVFDGPVDAEWIENLNTVLDDNKMLCLPDGKRIKLPNSFSMIFEVENLNVASPATVSRCGMVYFDKNTIDSFDAFIKFKQDLKDKIDSKIILDSRIKHMADVLFDGEIMNAFGSLLKSALTAFRSNSEQMIENVEYTIIHSGMKLFEIELDNLIDAVLKRAKETKVQSGFDKFLKTLEFKEMLFVIFSFSLVWSLGGNLTSHCKNELSKSLKIILSTRTGTLLMNSTSLFDFYFNYDKLQPASWKNMVNEFSYSTSMAYHNILVETSETTNIKYFLQQLTLKGVPILLNGSTGVGKTSIIKSFLQTLPENYVFSVSSFSAQTLSKNLENALYEKLSHRGKDLAPSAGKTLLFFIDDINMPKLDTYGSQPVNEMVRQIIDQGGFYDMKKYVFRPVKNTVFLAACAPAEGGRNPMSQRLVRHFHTLSISDISDDSYELIFGSILKGFFALQTGTANLLNSCSLIVKNSIKIYKTILTGLLPSPSKCHYSFNMRDLSKVFQGMLQADTSEIDNEDKLLALWLHELTRVFGDRLIDNPERMWFFEKLISVSQLFSKFTIDKLDGLNFTSIISGKYKLVNKPEELTTAIQEALKNYTLINGKDLGLILFPDMIKHICRIRRILSFSKGNALLLGISGCGKRALSNLAVFLNKNHIFKIEITRNYKVQSWRDDLKSVMKLAAEEPNLEGKKGVTFIMSEDQFVLDALLEDVNNILNIGEIPNLYTKDEIEEISVSMQSQIKDKKLLNSMSNADLWEYFLNNAKENFHLVLTFSPVGSNFRSKCRQFPSLINCCTIDYFSKWPAEALLTVAETEIKKGFFDMDELLVKKLARVLTFINETAEKASVNFFNQFRRKCYMTPSNYIDMLKSYIKLLKEARHSMPQKIKKYETGLQKLSDTKKEIVELQEKILAFQPKLEQAREENKILLKDLEEKNAVAKDKEVLCEKEANDISQYRNTVNGMRIQCQQELNEALPALYAAQNAARNIDKSYISTVKTYNTVAKDIEMVLLALNLLFGRKETWEEVKKFLSDIELIKKLQNLDPMTVPLKTWTKLRQSYLSRPEFNPTLLESKSEAISTLANYLINMEIYYFKKKEVDPKEKKLMSAEVELAEVEETMNTKLKELDNVKEVVNNLRMKLNSSLEREANLEDEQRRAKLHLERAEKLLIGLAEESKRWQEYAISLRGDEKNLIGDILLASAGTSFCGPFNQKFREELMKDWTRFITGEEILVSDNFSLQNALGDQVTIRDWQLKGLPADSFSVDNAIIVMNSVKFPLMIDPQMQMNKWLKNLYKDAGFIIIKNNNPMLLKLIENGIRFGNTILIENLDEKVDTSLEPVLLRQTIKKGPIQYLKLNDQEIPFNPDFRLFLTTKLQNPHYLPETTIKVNLINCMVTEIGLESQLLIEIVLNECPKLEEQRDSLIRQISDDKKQLLDIQNRILRLINEVQGNLLDDEELINTLDASKLTSEAINTRMKDSEVTNENINKAREIYKVLASQGAMIYFIVSSLVNINFMYQFSLEYFIAFFTKKMSEDEENKANVEKRVANLKTRLTFDIFKDVSRALFSKHKPFFAFILAVRTTLSNNQCSSRQWAFFSVPEDVDLKGDDQNSPDFMKERLWTNLCALSTINPKIVELKKHLKDGLKELKIILAKSDITITDFNFIQSKYGISDFDTMLVLKTLREEKLESIGSIFTEVVLGRDFLDHPPLDLNDAIIDAGTDKPIIFILSPGADPLSSMLTLAQEKKMENKFKIASLGQGQGDKANELIKTSRLNGEWVLLQNCHLAVSWLSQLEFLIENQSEETHADYKLFLTTMPSEKFPSSILQKAIKLANEPPKGIRANLRQAYAQIDIEVYNKNELPLYKTLLFCLSMFHAIALERKKFGPIGWNIPYEWMNSDLEISQKHLLMYLEDSSEVPFDTLNTLVGVINYGGRVTDYNDEKVVAALLLKFFNPRVLELGHVFSKDDEFEYKIPQINDLDSVCNYIESLPLVDKPCIFGLNENAVINQDLQNAKEFKNYVSLFEPTKQGSTSNESSDDFMVQMIDRMNERLGVAIKLDTSKTLQSITIFRNQEAERFNNLLSKIKASLSDLKEAIKGTVAMSIELENMLNCLMRQKVPENWEKVSYLSLKPISSWFDDFIKRIDFFKNWMLFGVMKSYWISAFFFPQGFMTAMLQTHSRDKQIAIDSLNISVKVLKEMFQSNEDVKTETSTGVIIHGLILENAHFDINLGLMTEAKPKELLEEMPLIWLDPIVESKNSSISKNVFQCPVYKTSDRRGELSTTGHSTNFMTYFDLPFDKENEDYWLRRGVAILLQTDE